MTPVRAWALAVLLGASHLAAAAPRAAGVLLEGSVVHVVDGDTIHVRLGARVEKVRYIGIDAPDYPERRGRDPSRPPRTHRARGARFPRSAAAAEAATLVNIQLVSGKTVRLELDRRRRDDYGRLLAWVWAGDTLVNAEMVRVGYARAWRLSPNTRHQHVVAAAERDARDAGRGLWTGR